MSCWPICFVDLNFDPETLPNCTLKAILSDGYLVHCTLICGLLFTEIIEMVSIYEIVCFCSDLHFSQEKTELLALQF